MQPPLRQVQPRWNSGNSTALVLESWQYHPFQLVIWTKVNQPPVMLFWVRIWKIEQYSRIWDLRVHRRGVSTWTKCNSGRLYSGCPYLKTAKMLNLFNIDKRTTNVFFVSEFHRNSGEWLICWFLADHQLRTRCPAGMDLAFRYTYMQFRQYMYINISLWCVFTFRTTVRTSLSINILFSVDPSLERPKKNKTKTRSLKPSN